MKMIFSYCNGCRYHETVEIDGSKHSRCLKENCLAVYTKCLTEGAVKQLIARDRDGAAEAKQSALEVCYPSV
jgi:hypothetical protein